MRLLPSLRVFGYVCGRQSMLANHIGIRNLQTTAIRNTDGVYTALTEMRVRTPWIEALRKQQKDGIDPRGKSDKPATPPDRDLTPKRMTDSYHRVVCTVSKEVLTAWLTNQT